MQTVKKILSYPFLIIFLGLIYFYKFCISPLLPSVCRFYPTCSSYAVQALKSYGPIKGTYIAAKRLCRCRGRNKGGCDYIPENIKREFKYFI